MAAISSSPALDSHFEVDKLTYEIFSILENKFLFGYNDPNQTPLQNMKSSKNVTGKVRILSIDGTGTTDGVLAARSLAHLEYSLRVKSNNPNAQISDYFDVVSGTGVGGILAALLFTRGKDGGPISTAEEALQFVIKHRGKISPSRRRGFFGAATVEKVLRKTFGEFTLKDTLKSVLIPCYDLGTRSPFLFSRADALEIDGYDFKMRDVCFATSVDPTVVGAFEMRSVDLKTKITAVDGGIAMNNPTAAAITHVLNNKHEFPFCNGLEDLLVVSLGNGESDFDTGKARLSPAAFVRIAGEGASDMVDQAVSMAFGQCRANCTVDKKKRDVLSMTEEMLGMKNVESVLFEGKKMAETTNMEKLELFARELMKEEERRKTSILPTVVLKQVSPSPRSSSATTMSTISTC